MKNPNANRFLPLPPTSYKCPFSEEARTCQSNPFDTYLNSLPCPTNGEHFTPHADRSCGSASLLRRNSAKYSVKSPDEIEKLTSGDLAHKTTKVALATIPVAGSAIAELFTTIIEEPVQRRRVQWLTSIHSKLKAAEAKIESLSIEKLGGNEEFVSILMTASQIAQRNHQEEKLEALRNTVINTALKIDIREDLKFMFLSFVDELTVTELKIMAVTSDPIRYAKDVGEEVGPEDKKNKILNLAFPDRVEQRNVYKMFAKNLHSKGLLGVDNLTLNFSSRGKPLKVTTDLGDSFLRFIERPETLPNNAVEDNLG